MSMLLLTTCLLSAPSNCQPTAIPFNGPVVACAQFGQLAITEWLRDHPKRFAAPGYRCRPYGQEA